MSEHTQREYLQYWRLRYGYRILFKRRVQFFQTQSLAIENSQLVKEYYERLSDDAGAVLEKIRGQFGKLDEWLWAAEHPEDWDGSMDYGVILD